MPREFFRQHYHEVTPGYVHILPCSLLSVFSHHIEDSSLSFPKTIEAGNATSLHRRVSSVALESKVSGGGLGAQILLLRLSGM